MNIIAIDTGGTFTDFVLMQGETVRTYKCLSSPENPSQAVLKGIQFLIPDLAKRKDFSIIHGTTVATNAVLQRKTANTALITTSGFEDVIEIGRGQRLSLYDLSVQAKPELVPRDLRFSVKERVDKNAEVLIPLIESELTRLYDLIKSRTDIESIAVVLLFSFANPVHEKMIKAKLSSLKLPISISSEILPEYREYERSCTTVINASVTPVMSLYLSDIELNAGVKKINIMQSNGGTIGIQKLKENAVHSILSGPAGGVVGAFEIAKLSGFDKIISFDMGGTSTDVSLCNGEINTSHYTEINHIPIKVPAVDIHTVGAGGGSIAFMDNGRALCVGPISAGADPGPICYGKGNEITVTDANLYLGRLDSQNFLGSEMKLQHQPLDLFFNALAQQLAISPVDLAEGIITVVNHKMVQAIRLISVEKGHDPKNFSLVSFGGAGGLHCCDLSALLDIPQVLCPKNPGLLSAMGMTLSDVVKYFSKTVVLSQADAESSVIDELFQPLVTNAVNAMQVEGFDQSQCVIEKLLDVRYAGQSFELTVPYTDSWADSFQQSHFRLYHHSDVGRDLELVTLRVKITGLTQKPTFIPIPLCSENPSQGFIYEKKIIYKGDAIQAKIFNRDKLKPGNIIIGPAIIVEYSSTLFIHPDFLAYVDEYETILVKKLN